MTEQEMNEIDLRMCVMFEKKQITLYEVLGIFMHSPRPLPNWVVQAVEKGFDDRINGKRDFDEIFGLTPKPGKQIDKSARKLTYAPSVYFEVVMRSERGQAIDEAMFEDIASIYAPTFLKEWPNAKPPSGRTLKEWYLEELRNREPELAESRNKTNSKTA